MNKKISDIYFFHQWDYLLTKITVWLELQMCVIVNYICRWESELDKSRDG